MEVNNLTTENFEEEVINSNELVLVDFWAIWCTPCKMMAPIVEEISKDMAGKVKVCKVNIDKSPELAQKYNVMSIPTFLVFKNGNVIARTVGVQEKEDIMELLK